MLPLRSHSRQQSRPRFPTIAKWAAKRWTFADSDPATPDIFGPRSLLPLEPFDRGPKTSSMLGKVGYHGREIAGLAKVIPRRPSIKDSRNYEFGLAGLFASATVA
jgi:hypothetical protein